MGYVIAALGVTGTVIAAFIAGWIVGPRIITPLVQKLLAKASNAVQSAK